MAKYNNKKPVLDGIKFDSIMEMEYYVYLKHKKKRKEIKDFELQPKFVLVDKFKRNGKTIRAITYTPDFKIINLDDSVKYVDTKGFATEISKLKKKLFHYVYPNIDLSWVVYSPPKVKIGECGFVDKDELDEFLKKIKKEKKNGK